MSSAVLVGLRLTAEVRAFSVAISGVATLAPSRRSRVEQKAGVIYYGDGDWPLIFRGFGFGGGDHAVGVF